MNKSCVIVVGLISYSYSSACCGVFPSGKPVRFGDQTNIVVWNPQTRMEHFVRNAYFDQNSPDFGFIAPSPVKPMLSTADRRAFDALDVLRPTTRSAYGKGGPPAGAASAPGPKILQRVHVGKYEATTLQSKDAKSIENYLQKNGYTTSPDFREWASLYAKKGWVLTAFKVRKDRDYKISDTGIIRMSFKTEQPFNPYYVPKNNIQNGSNLRIYFVSDGVYSATVGQKTPWLDSRWSSPVPSAILSQVATGLKLGTKEMPGNPTVTYFEKFNWLDGSKDDLYFHKK